MARGEATPPGIPDSDAGNASEDVAIAPELAASIEILVAEPDRAGRDGCAQLLRSRGFGVTVAASSGDALALVRRRRFDLLLVDAELRPAGGLGVMREALAAHPGSLVIVTTAHPTVPASLEALREGAWDYVPKPFTGSHLDILVGRAVHDILAARSSAVPLAAGLEVSEEMLLGTSDVVRAALDVARRVAPTNTPVLLDAPSGAGAGRLARYIHARSSRAGNVFLVVDCSVVTVEELFGRQARGSRGLDEEPGLLEAASGGTLCLRDLDRLAPPLQKRLEQVLEERVLPRPRPSAPAKPFNVRFISSLRDRDERGAQPGKLRRELLQRLGKVSIRLTPLRDRPDDIPAIAEHLLRCFWVEQHGACPPPRLTPAALAWLRSLPWPGNVRQLARVMERIAVIGGSGAELEPDDIPIVSDSREEAGGGIYAAILDDVYSAAKEKLIAQFEREYFPRLVSRARGNMARAARMAAVDRRTLYRLMDKHGLRRDPDQPELHD